MYVVCAYVYKSELCKKYAPMCIHACTHACMRLGGLAGYRSCVIECVRVRVPIYMRTGARACVHASMRVYAC